MSPVRFLRASAFTLIAAAAAAQNPPPKPLSLVMPHGPGRILYSFSTDYKVESLSVLDNGTRPVLFVKNQRTDVNVSFILFPNDTGAPTAEGCRDAVVEPILRGVSQTSEIKNDRKSTYTTPSGTSIVTRSYLIKTMLEAPIQQENLFGFFGDASTCAEIHISKTAYKPEDETLLNNELDRFQYEAAYQPSFQDYAALATIFFRSLKAPADAAFYYQSAVTALPAATPENLKIRRLLTDQLAMSYGMSGNLKQSRAVATSAIAADPDYPLNYYNLACADAEQGHAQDARLHLQQAFDRKANTLPGEALPDPAKDDSILKLKKDKSFWAFVETLK